jgi:hypothetical protein
LIDDHWYAFRVRAWNTFAPNYSAWSSWFAFKTLPFTDTYNPQSITDMVVSSKETTAPYSITLKWTAPADQRKPTEGAIYDVTSYEVRYTTSHEVDGLQALLSNFNSLPTLEGLVNAGAVVTPAYPIVPVTHGTTQEVKISNIPSGTYLFIIKTYDAVGNFSMSNVNGDSVGVVGGVAGNYPVVTTIEAGYNFISNPSSSPEALANAFDPTKIPDIYATANYGDTPGPDRIYDLKTLNIAWASNVGGVHWEFYGGVPPFKLEPGLGYCYQRRQTPGYNWSFTP